MQIAASCAQGLPSLLPVLSLLHQRVLSATACSTSYLWRPGPACMGMHGSMHGVRCMATDEQLPRGPPKDRIRAIPFLLPLPQASVHEWAIGRESALSRGV
jgi:hypothetical protein